MSHHQQQQDGHNGGRAGPRGGSRLGRGSGHRGQNSPTSYGAPGAFPSGQPGGAGAGGRLPQQQPQYGGMHPGHQQPPQQQQQQPYLGPGPGMPQQPQTGGMPVQQQAGRQPGMQQPQQQQPAPGMYNAPPTHGGGDMPPMQQPGMQQPMAASGGAGGFTGNNGGVGMPGQPQAAGGHANPAFDPVVAAAMAMAAAAEANGGRMPDLPAGFVGGAPLDPRAGGVSPGAPPLPAMQQLPQQQQQPQQPMQVFDPSQQQPRRQQQATAGYAHPQQQPQAPPKPADDDGFGAGSFGPGGGYTPSFPQPQQDAGEGDAASPAAVEDPRLASSGSPPGPGPRQTRRNQPYARVQPGDSPQSTPSGADHPPQQPTQASSATPPAQRGVMGRGRSQRPNFPQQPAHDAPPGGNDASMPPPDQYGQQQYDHQPPQQPQRTMGRGGGQQPSTTYAGPRHGHVDPAEAGGFDNGSGGGYTPMSTPGGADMPPQPPAGRGRGYGHQQQQQQQQQPAGFMQPQPQQQQQQRHGRGGGYAGADGGYGGHGAPAYASQPNQGQPAAGYQQVPQQPHVPPSPDPNTPMQPPQQQFAAAGNVRIGGSQGGRDANGGSHLAGHRLRAPGGGADMQVAPGGGTSPQPQQQLPAPFQQQQQQPMNPQQQQQQPQRYPSTSPLPQASLPPPHQQAMQQQHQQQFQQPQQQQQRPAQQQHRFSQSGGGASGGPNTPLGASVNVGSTGGPRQQPPQHLTGVSLGRPAVGGNAQHSPSYPQQQQPPQQQHPGRASAEPAVDMSPALGMSSTMELSGSLNAAMPRVGVTVGGVRGDAAAGGGGDGHAVRVGPPMPTEVIVGPRGGAAGGGGARGRRDGPGDGSGHGSPSFEGAAPPVVTVGGGGATPSASGSPLGGSLQQQQQPGMAQSVPAGLSVVVGKHLNTGVAVQRSTGVIDATTAPPRSDAGSAAASAVQLPAEYHWMLEVQQSSASAMLYTHSALRAQQSPRSGLLHMLYLMSDRAAELLDPASAANLVTELVHDFQLSPPSALSGGVNEDGSKVDPWTATLPNRSFGIFRIARAQQLARKNKGGDQGDSVRTDGSRASSLSQHPRRPGLRPILVDGDLFVSNILRALHQQDAKWFLIADVPDILNDICTSAVVNMFQGNGLEPRFIFSGVPGAECDMDALALDARVLKLQDHAWNAISNSWQEHMRGAHGRMFPAGGGGGGANGGGGDEQQQDEVTNPLQPTTGSGRPLGSGQQVGSLASLCSFLNDDPLDGPIRTAFAQATDLHLPVGDSLREAVATHLSDSLGYEVVRAPQLSWAQAAAQIAEARMAMNDTPSASSVCSNGPAFAGPPLHFYGPPEALLVDGIDHVVLAIDNEGKCLILDRSAVEDAVYVRNPGSIRLAKRVQKAAAASVELDAEMAESSSGDDDAENADGSNGNANTTSGGGAGAGLPHGLSGDQAGMQPPAVTNSIAATLTAREKRRAFVDLGLMTTTHAQLKGFTVNFPADSVVGHGLTFLRQFNYRTLVPFSASSKTLTGLTSTSTIDGKPADQEQPDDCDRALDEWLELDANRATSGIGRYRIDRLIALGLDTRTMGGSFASLTGATGAAKYDTVFLRNVRGQKWRLQRGRAFLAHSSVAAPGVVPATVEDGDVRPDVTSLSRVLAAFADKPSSPAACKIPSNLKDVCGGQVPPMLQYAHFVGALRPSTLSLYAHLYDKTERPVVDSFLLRKCLNRCTSVLCALAFEELIGTMIGHDDAVDAHIGEGITPTSWLFPLRGRRSRFSRADLDDWPLSRFDELADGAPSQVLPIDLHSVLYLSTKGVTPRADPDRDPLASEVRGNTYHTRRQFIAAVHLKLLDFLGYFVHPDPVECELGMYGKALARFPASLNIMIDTYGQPNPINDTVTRQVTGSYAQQVILLIELLRTESLTSKETVWVTAANWDTTRRLNANAAAGVVMATEMEPNMSLPTRAERAAVLLASRVSSLCPITVHAPWTGLLDRELAGFSAITNHLQRALRRVADVLAASILTSGRYVGDLEDLAGVGKELPLSTPHSLAAGSVVRFIIESPDDFGIGLTTPEERLSYVAAVFPCLLPDELCRSVVRPGTASAMAKATSNDEAAAAAAAAGDDNEELSKSACMEGRPRDDDIDFRNPAVVAHMSSVVDEVFGFWDIALHVARSLRELAKEEYEEGTAAEAQRSVPHDLLHMFQASSHLMNAKRVLFGSAPPADVADMSDALDEDSSPYLPTE